VTVEGDNELGHRFGKLLAGMDVDWEEQLSRITGDVVAHEMGKGARAIGNWSTATLDTASKNLQEYLQEEIRLLPTRYELEEFLAEVDTLRDDVARLQARLQRVRARFLGR
jgi:ubiquinone biosynthesis protein UbiJ